MYDPMERLQSLRVADVMTRDVVQIRAWQPMCEVAALFRDREISAAPVVDEQGKCVGILSATDFLARDSSCGESRAAGVRHSACHVKEGSERQPLQISRPADDVAGEWMTDAVQTISSDAPLPLAARMMCAQHVHRLVVIDERHQPCGMISTLDLISTLVNILDEQAAAV